MKKSFLLIFFLIFFSGISQSQLLLEENFEYTAGDSLNAANGWINFSGTNNPIMIISPGLTYAGYPSVVGNAAKIRNTGNDLYKAFNNATTGALYASFLVNVDTLASGDYFLAFLPTTSTTNYTARVYARDSSGSLSFGVSKSAVTQGPIVYTGADYQKNVTYLLIVKYKFNTGSNTDDDVSLYVFTSPYLPVTEPLTPTVGPVTSTANDAADLGRIALRQGTTSTSPILKIDGIRVFNSWNELVSIKNISGNVPTNNALKQNYPNPFNPNTLINFQIMRFDKVNLTIHDVLGREVEILLDEYIGAGTYEVNFNGTNYPSGIYYYTLTVNGFKDTKKMILVK